MEDNNKNLNIKRTEFDKVIKSINKEIENIKNNKNENKSKNHRLDKNYKKKMKHFRKIQKKK